MRGVELKFIVVDEHQVIFQRLGKTISLECDEIDFTKVPEDILSIVLVPSMAWDTRGVCGKTADETVKTPSIPREVLHYIDNERKWRNGLVIKPKSFNHIKSWETTSKTLLPFGGGKETWLQHSILNDIGANFSTFYVRDQNESRTRPIEHCEKIKGKKYLFRTNHRLARLQYFGVPLLLSYIGGYDSVMLGSDAGHHTEENEFMRYYGMTPLWQMVTNKLMESLNIDFRFSSLVSCLPPGAVLSVLCRRYGDVWKNMHSIPHISEFGEKFFKKGRFYFGKFHRICAMLISNGKRPEDVGLDSSLFYRMLKEDPNYIIKCGEGSYRDDIQTFLPGYKGHGWGNCILADKIQHIHPRYRDDVLKIFRNHIDEYSQPIPKLSEEKYSEYMEKLTDGF